jgi:osmotically-inducible protein OsmY/sporulation protein YlmC with PRC-barrel domain
MTEPRLEMAIESPVKPTTDTWGQIKQRFFGFYQDQSSQSDKMLAEKIMRALGADNLLRRTDVTHIRVLVNDGVATLNGHVVRSMNKARAQAAASEAPGVLGVVNQLVVDDELMIDVAQALGHDRHTQGEQIQVNVQHVVVYLGGAVKRAAVRAAAAEVAANIPQARGIINLIQTPGIVMDTDEERIVQPLVEREIYATDGQVGRVQQVIINPHNRRVTAVVVRSHISVLQDPDLAQLPDERPQPQRHILIPMSSLWCAPSGALFLNVNSAAAAGFADFNVLSFVAPPQDWQPPYPYRPIDVLFCR